MVKKIAYIVIVLLALLGIFALSQPKQMTPVVVTHQVPSVTQEHASFSYSGVKGKDALALLQTQTAIELDKTGMVASINGRRADTKKKEYWAFYVNGKYAQVGPKDYQTKDDDKIIWKIETY